MEQDEKIVFLLKHIAQAQLEIILAVYSLNKDFTDYDIAEEVEKMSKRDREIKDL